MSVDGEFVGVVRQLDSNAPVVPFFIAIGDRKHGPFATIADATEFAAGFVSGPKWRVVRKCGTAKAPPEAPPGECVSRDRMARPPDAPVRRYRHIDFRTVSTD
jgi:hypothetical protein